MIAVALGSTAAARADAIKTVFVIAMENHNATQPASDTTAPAALYGNANAPYLNSLITPGNANAAQTSYATAYHNVLATAAGTGPSIHPSEPNYLWMEGGTNYGVTNDNQPYGTGGNNQTTTTHFSSLLTSAGKTWKSYQEDINTDSAGNVVAQSQWTSPITNRSGTYTTVANAYNGSKQYDYAVKHNPMAFFTDTNGGNDTTTANAARLKYAPLQQLQSDLASNSVANYNWISPNQFNDMHTALTGGYKSLTGDAAAIRQGDDFLASIVPQIMASQAYQDHGAIMLWWDETEGTNANDFNHTLPFILISPDAKGNAFAASANYTHSSTLLTLQHIYGVDGTALGDAASATTNDLSSLFKPTVTNVPEPTTTGLIALATTALLARRQRRP